MNAAGYSTEDRALPHRSASVGVGRPSERFVMEPVLALKRALSPRVDLLPDAASGAGRALIDSSAAMRELFTVHRIEQARLLLRASRLRCASTRVGRVFLALCAEEHAGSRWRSEVTEELNACLLDGWEPPAALARCVAQSCAAWSSARVLARTALSLEPSTAARMQLARAELCEGSAETGLASMRDLVARLPSAARSAELLECLALTSEANARWEAACAHYAELCREAAMDRTETRLAAHAAWLALALRAGDIRQAERARAHLVAAVEALREDESVGADALAKLRARVRFHRDAGRWQLSNAARSWLQAWIASGCGGGESSRDAARLHGSVARRRPASGPGFVPRPEPSSSRSAENLENRRRHSAEWPLAVALALL